MKSYLCRWSNLLILLFGLFVHQIGTAQNFSGQTVTMVVNYAAGGPTDIEARLAAKFLPKYLSGVRAVVVRNVGGGGGVIAINQMGEASERDSFNIGFFTWNPLAQLIEDKSLKVKYSDLNFIAGFRQLSLVYARKDTAPGIVTSADIAKAKFIKAGALGHSNVATIRQRLALDLLGAKYETIAGYKGLSEIVLAVRRGDLDLSADSLPGWVGTVKPSLVDTGIAIPLFQYDFEKNDGTLGRNPELPDIPSFSEVFAEVKQGVALPKNDRSQALLLLTRIVDVMYRTVFMPTNAPPSAVAEMRIAFERLVADPEFISDYQRVVRTRPNFVSSVQGSSVIADLNKTPASLINFLRAYVDSNR
jgi:hypothetical protein